MRGCSPEHFPSFDSLSAAAHRTAPCLLRRTSSSSSRPFTFAAARSSFASLLYARRVSRLALFFSGRCAQHCSRQLAVSSLVGCSLEHFPLTHLPLLAAYIRRRFSRVRSFARFCTRLSHLLSLSLHYSQLCSASLALLLCIVSALVPRLQPLLFSCLSFPLFQARHPSSI